jgi:hypothetical protein
MREQEPHKDCPHCHGTGECSNAQFLCICRWHLPGCKFLRNYRDACQCADSSDALESAHQETDLRPWVQHKPECPQAMAPPADYSGPVPAIAFGPCTCGLDAALGKKVD